MPGDFVSNDLASFLRTDELGDDAVYNGNSIDVQFYNEYDAAVIFDLEVESASPQAIARDSDIPNIAHGSEVTINSVVYKVRGVQPDGKGMTLLILSKD